MIAPLRVVLWLLADVAGLIVLSVRPRRAIEAESLVLRRQLALFRERGMEPRRIDAATRARLTLPSRWCDWRSCRVVALRSRRLLHAGVTQHPSAEWTLRLLRGGVGFDQARCYLIHVRDSIFARSLGDSISNPGLTALNSPPYSPKANAICERVIGTIRRECLDWLIPPSEPRLRSILKSSAGQYNHGRPHRVLGPGAPDPPSAVPQLATTLSRHRIGEDLMVHVRSVQGGLHHEHSFAPALA